MTGSLTTVQTLGDVSRTYDTLAQEYSAITQRAGEAEATYRQLKAKAVVKAKFDGNAVSLAEYIADADEAVSRACYEYKIATAAADAARARLTQLRARLDFGRTLAASEREVDKLHASGMSGAA